MDPIMLRREEDAPLAFTGSPFFEHADQGERVRLYVTDASGVVLEVVARAPAGSSGTRWWYHASLHPCLEDATDTLAWMPQVGQTLYDAAMDALERLARGHR